MIIVKTTEGVHYINEKEWAEVKFNQEAGMVYLRDKMDGSFDLINVLDVRYVISVRYVSDSSQVEDTTDSNEFDKLKKDLSEAVRDSSYFRQLLTLTTNAIYDIEEICKRTNENKTITEIVEDCKKRMDDIIEIRTNQQQKKRNEKGERD